MMSLDASPRREIRRRPFRDGLVACVYIPNAHFAHHVRRREMPAIGCERAAEHGRRVVERGEEVTRERVEYLHRWFCFRGGLILPSAGEVLPGGGRDASAVRGERQLPAPEIVRLHAAP